ncbi:hypothetical protein GGR56DRAFT_424121 [Xylariaceae sp. FL0804]|nr:hypothetical protein GGR56DRAFT_424121 [Xylariaceae sp. FL0804]
MDSVTGPRPHQSCLWDVEARISDNRAARFAGYLRSCIIRCIFLGSTGLLTVPPPKPARLPATKAEADKLPVSSFGPAHPRLTGFCLGCHVVNEKPRGTYLSQAGAAGAPRMDRPATARHPPRRQALTGGGARRTTGRRRSSCSSRSSASMHSRSLVVSVLPAGTARGPVGTSASFSARSAIKRGRCGRPPVLPPWPEHLMCHVTSKGANISTGGSRAFARRGWCVSHQRKRLHNGRAPRGSRSRRDGTEARGGCARDVAGPLGHNRRLPPPDPIRQLDRECEAEPAPQTSEAGSLSRCTHARAAAAGTEC